MRTLALSFRYLWARPLAAALNLLLLSLGLASITLMLLVSEQIERAFQRDLAGIDLVVGAKGSPMQLILAGVFHIDVPPGNIALAEVKVLQQDPRVAKLIPLSLGDSFRGFRLVGTTADYLHHYRATLAQGALWRAPMQTVLGAGVASATGLKVGEHFVGAHGLGGGGHAHDDEAFVVSGVLAPCQCVLDRLILTATESVWQVHEQAPAQGEPEQRAKQAGREITMALIQYASPLAAVTLPRHVNSATGMQAAAPAVEVTRLLRMVGVGTDVLRGFALVLLLTAGLSVFIALWNALRERRADLAMLRMLGASPGKLARLLVCEALWLALLAAALGLAGGHLMTALVGLMLQSERSLPVSGCLTVAAELWIPLVAVLVAVFAALIPAVGAYRVDAGELLDAR